MQLSQGRASVGIVGGGIIGLSAARRLAQAGLVVTVYEKALLGGEASWAGAGMLSPGGEFERDSELARLALESRALYPKFVEELRRESGLAIDLQETGALDVAYSTEELAHLAERAERQGAMGISSKPMRPKQITAFWPRLRQQDLAGGYFYPGDAYVNPRDVMAALQICCRQADVIIAEQTEIRNITVSGETVTVDGVRHDFAVVAGGAWSGWLAVSGVPPLPLSEPVRGHLLAYRQPEQTCHTIIRHGHTYLLQRANGLLIVGASVERVGFDRMLDQTAVTILQDEAAALMPHLSETSPTEVWNGFRPGSDQLQVGSWHGSPLYLAYGHYRNGILLAPVTAKLLTDSIIASLQKR